MDDLLSGLVPGLPESARQAILVRAEGIPLYAVETVRKLLARRTAGAHRRSLSADRRPDPCRGARTRSTRSSRLVSMRLDRRSGRCSRTPRSWARRSRWPRSSAVSGDAGARAGAALAGPGPARRPGPEPRPRSPERGQYGFVQALIREVAYGTMARRDRRARHLAAARYFESLGDDELAERPRHPLPRCVPRLGPGRGSGRGRRPGPHRAPRRGRASRGAPFAGAGAGVPGAGAGGDPRPAPSARRCWR